MRSLNENGIGVPLLASFNNGIITKCVRGTPMNEKDMEGLITDPRFAECVFISLSL